MLLFAHVRGAERPATLDDRDVIAFQLRVAQVVRQHAEEIDEGVRLTGQS